MNKVVIILLVLSLNVCFVLASHNISGVVLNASDGTDANERMIVLWNPEVGMQDNLTDVIGINGASGSGNSYLIDCSLLDDPCGFEDELYLKVVDSENRYVSEVQSVFVSSGDSTVVGDILLNSPPLVEFIFPENGSIFSSNDINFNCSVFDYDSGLSNVSLFGNWSGEWVLNETKGVSGQRENVSFLKKLYQGFYVFNCMVSDFLGVSSFYSENFSFMVDTTEPIVNYVDVNVSYVCGSGAVRVFCNVSDDFSGIDSVIIESFSSSGSSKGDVYYLGDFLYYSDFYLDEFENWSFVCSVNDSAGNYNNLSYDGFLVYYESADFSIDDSDIVVYNENPIEGEDVLIGVGIWNNGCEDAVGVNVSLFEGHPDLGGLFFSNESVNINERSFIDINFSWVASMGDNELFFHADSDDSFVEEDEQDNFGNVNISVVAWQILYGNISYEKILGFDLNKIYNWDETNFSGGNIFVTNSEESVDWLSLYAVGRNTDGVENLSQFYDVDFVLNMTDFEDSVSNYFLDNGVLRNESNFSVFGNIIENVGIVYSSANFYTGLLWDSSKDDDGGFDLVDKEDLVFINKINKSSIGVFGVYDYEIKIPASLRSYNSGNNEVYLYYEIN